MTHLRTPPDIYDTDEHAIWQYDDATATFRALVITGCAVVGGLVVAGGIIAAAL